MPSAREHGDAGRDALRSQRRHRGGRRRALAAKVILVALSSVVVAVLLAFALAPRPRPSDSAAISSSPILTSTPTAVFLGDSYTVGVGSDEAPWPRTVSKNLGWNPRNLAAGGTGYNQTASFQGCGREHCGAYLEMSEKIPAAPSYIIVSGGRNDPGSDDGAAAKSLFDSLRQRFPDATIIALSPWWDASEVPASLTAKAESIKAAAESAGVSYLDTGQPFTGHPELISPDGVHPNADGYRVLAERLTTILSQATGTTPAA